MQKGTAYTAFVYFLFIETKFYFHWPVTVSK